MAFDPHPNLAFSRVAVAPSPGASGPTLTVTSGDGALFRSGGFNVVVWPFGTQPLRTNAEIARVTGVAGDVLTLVRAQEGSPARTIVAGDQIMAAVTEKSLTDIEAAIPVPVPLRIPSGTIYTVPADVQVLFSEPISVEAGGQLYVRSGGVLARVR